MLGRPIVLIQANIHGGEVEGKEASLHLLRRLTLGDLRPILNQVVVLAIPNYNADGNEAVDLANRSDQYGPIGGVGRRENAKGLDLNRDYMKLDSAEARAFVGVLNTWDPHVVVDLHTTNGSHHGYHLTYSIPVNHTLEPKLLEFERNVMMPALRNAMLERHSFRTYYYGNFNDRALRKPDPATRSWVAFDHRPRLGQNYVGLRNRIAILSEAYSYLDFERRIAVTEAFVAEILAYTAAHSKDIVDLTQSLDAVFLERARGANPMELGVEYEVAALPEPVPILVGKTTTRTNPRSGRTMTAVVPDSYEAVTMSDFGFFRPTRSVPMAKFYVLGESPQRQAALELLRNHGIAIEVLVEPWTADLSEFVVEKIERSSRPFQGRHERTLSGRYAARRANLPAGTALVRLDQPLGRLAAYLLEPESDDGIFHWGIVEVEGPGATVPIAKVEAAAGLLTRTLDHN
jgi:Zinc carboxypeptidase